MGARLLDALVTTIIVVVVLVLFGRSERPFSAIALAWTAVLAYESLFVVAFGATPGKLVVGQRVVSLGAVGRPSLAVAAKRGAVNATFTVLVILGWAIWLSSTLTDALGRGIADRAAETMVVPRATLLPIAARDLPGYADGARRPRLSRLGRIGDLDVRVRARLRRLLDAPALVAAIGLLALAASLPVSTATLLLASSSVWVIVFIVDEARRVARSGATAGHRQAGLVIVDLRTGHPPTLVRSIFRAIVLGSTLYIFLLWPLLVISMLLMRFGSTGRGLHDLAGGTVVVADPTLDPEVQRQRAMRMRIGRAA